MEIDEARCRRRSRFVGCGENSGGLIFVRRKCPSAQTIPSIAMQHRIKKSGAERCTTTKKKLQRSKEQPTRAAGTAWNLLNRIKDRSVGKGLLSRYCSSPLRHNVRAATATAPTYMNTRRASTASTAYALEGCKIALYQRFFVVVQLRHKHTRYTTSLTFERERRQKYAASDSCFQTIPFRPVLNATRKWFERPVIPDNGHLSPVAPRNTAGSAKDVPSNAKIQCLPPRGRAERVGRRAPAVLSCRLGRAKMRLPKMRCNK